MAYIKNPKKTFQFGVIAAGLNPYAVQSVNIPSVGAEVVTHGDVNRDIKTAGRLTFGDITLTKLRPIEVADNWIWTWIVQIQSIRTGGGLLAQQYKRDFDIVQYSYDNVTVTDRWAIEGAWPSQINEMPLDRTQSENAVESVTLTIDGFEKVQ